MSSVVYWIHLPEHTDMFTQGYVGVTKDMKKRFADHKNTTENVHLLRAIKKYGWDALVKSVVVIAEQAYCLMIESKLRADDKTGWNIVKGGGMPPISKWNLGKHLSAETRAKISAKNMGRKHTPEMQKKLNLNLTEGGKATRFVKGQSPHNKGKSMPEHVKKAILKANTGRVQSQEEKDKRAKSLIGHRVSDFTRERMRQIGLNSPRVMKGKHFPKVKCPHCEVTGGIIPMK